MTRTRLALDTRVLDGRFTAWGEERQVDLTRAWLPRAADVAWVYPLHYFDYLPPLADSARDDAAVAPAVCDLVRRWIHAHPAGTPIAWDPYPTALRIVNWLDAVHTLGDRVTRDWRHEVLANVYAQAGWLRRRLERHLLGTHLLKNAKALWIAGTAFVDTAAASWRREAHALLVRELSAQIHDDGSHLEPSVMYHCMALEDVLDLLNFAGSPAAPLGDVLVQAANRMLEYAVAVQTPSGGYPLLGDAWEGGAATPAALAAYAERLSTAWPAASSIRVRQSPRAATVPVGERADAAGSLRHFADAGLAVWRGARFHVVTDVGGVGPPHLPAHGHCDSLSFECWVDGVPIVADSGTWTYAAGERRHACRATASHNTIELDGREQHEIWAVFRVGRRSRVRATRPGANIVEATLVPWFDRGLRQRRRFEFDARRLRIHDRVEGRGRHRIVSRVHLHPDCDVVGHENSVEVRHGTARARIDFISTTNPQASLRLLGAKDSASYHAAEAGVLRPRAMLQMEWEGKLPFDCRVEIVALPSAGSGP